MSLATTANISGTFSGAASFGAAAVMSPQVGQTVTLQQEPSLFLDAFSSMQRGMSSQQQASPDDRMKALQQRFDAALQSAQIWKPTSESMNANKVIKGADNLSAQHGQAKADAADTMRSNQIGEIKAVMKEAQLAGGQLQMPEPKQGGGSGMSLGGAAGGLAMDAVLTGAATIALGPVGGLVATGLMAAKAGIQGAGLEGQGTLVTFNQSPGYFGSALSSKGRSKGRDSESAYESSGSGSPAPVATTAPVTNNFQQNMSKGPGFGRANALGDLGPRMTMSEQSLDQIAIKLADDSPAGKQIRDMKENATYTKGILNKQSRDGVDATADNVAAAYDIGMDHVQQGPKLQTFKMS